MNKNIISKTITFALFVFAVVTLFMTTSIVFDLFGIREKEGNYVNFIVYANLICGVLYLLSIYGFFTAKKWASHLLIVATLILLIAFIELLLYISVGGIYEKKTIFAMIFRILITSLFALYFHKKLKNKTNN